DQLADHAFELAGRLPRTEPRQVVQIDAFEQLAMDAQLEVLTGAVGGGPAAACQPTCRRFGFGRRRRGAAIECQTISEFHGAGLLPRVKMRPNRRPRFALPAVSAPTSLPISASIAVDSGELPAPLSGVPAFIS